MHKGKGNAIEYSSFPISEHKERLIKDVDVKQGIVTGYFSIFGNVDSDGDMIMPGAFKKTLSENAHRIKHLWQHNPLQPLAKPTEIKEDVNGLYFTSQISKTSYGKDAILLYADGVIDEHSIGFNTIREQKAMSYNEILEVKLWEGSSVTWGANEMARSESIKSMSKEQVFDKMNTVLKAIRNGKYENEDIFDMLEIYFKQLQQHIIDLSTPISTPAAEEAPEPQPDTMKDEDVARLLVNINNIKINLK